MKRKITACAAAAVTLLSLTGCGNAAKTYTDYVQSVLDCTYKNITDKYMELTESTTEEAADVYQGEVDYMVQLIYYYYDVYEDYVDDSTKTGYEALAKDILAKVNYTVEPAVRSGSSYHVTVTSQPIDFWDITYDAVNELYDDKYADRFLDESLSDEDYEAAEGEWASDVLTTLSGYTSQIGYKDTQSTIVEITTADDGTYGIDEKMWLDIDDLLLDVDGNISSDE